MDPIKPRAKKGPEAIIQLAIIKALTLRGWFVMVTHGNMYQSGFPDLYATHRHYGGKWIEVKNKEAYRFQPSQMETFPKLVANGSGVWVLVSADDEEIKKLLKPCNWHHYITGAYNT